METVKLNNGVEMPALGLGVFLMSETEVRSTVPMALDAGYRMIDTASRYYNEEAVGRSIAESGISRDQLFVTSKLWFKDHGEEATKRAFQVTLDKLGLDYLDLYLIHQPFGDYYGAWRAMEDLYEQGLIRAIGVSNFYPDRYLDLVTFNKVVPAVDQREVHPLNQQKDMVKLASEHGTVVQAWAPLAQGSKQAFDSPILKGIAAAHHKSVAQVMLRWLLQRGIPMVAKSTHENRLRENIDIFDFQLTDPEMDQIASMDQARPIGGRTHYDPELFQAVMQLQ
ncbi:aldo/keto reductase [Bombiscardovia nodaiensis]|uniref:Aldo/keto reductase n=1 Tax=Bombiscardovia nodaiensis TaxID=2932181 RepID=A0ABN6SEV4_9BIFI|nr:aldo/keto reductase [Bombiscardovia nodaiensis]